MHTAVYIAFGVLLLITAILVGKNKDKIKKPYVNTKKKISKGFKKIKDATKEILKKTVEKQITNPPTSLETLPFKVTKDALSSVGEVVVEESAKNILKRSFQKMKRKKKKRTNKRF